MFSTFSVVDSRSAAGDNARPKATAASRPKRSQVRRACYWCKLMRIRCDSHRPCSNCQQAGRECVISGDHQFRSIAEAVQEVKRLRTQVRQYEDNNNKNNNTTSTPTATSAPVVTISSDQQQNQQSPYQNDEQQEQQERQQSPQHHRASSHDQLHLSPPEYQEERRWSESSMAEPASSEPHSGSPAGASTSSTSAPSSKASTSEMSLYPNKTSPGTDRPPSAAASRIGIRVDSIPYGVTSPTFFLARMDHYLQNVRPQVELRVELAGISTSGASTSAASMSRPSPRPYTEYHSQQDASMPKDGYLTRFQESLFLNLFWQTHYFSYPILNEGQFRREFAALWNETPEGEPRKASPLVDIVIALCVQLGGFLVRQNKSWSARCANEGNNPQQQGLPVDAHSAPPSLGGFVYYQRCQNTIDQMIDCPSIENVQCYIFNIVYLCEAGLLNRAQVVAGKAIMMAMILGLPNEPPPHMP
ncbi:hypothetical protein F4778DRAFT_549805, partial [Xylariomycetidae sp. FL2044]